MNEVKTQTEKTGADTTVQVGTTTPPFDLNMSDQMGGCAVR